MDEEVEIDEFGMRLEALRLAVQHGGNGDDVVDRATAYFAFLTGAPADDQ